MSSLQEGSVNERIAQMLREKSGIKLDLACGPVKQQGDGWVGLDIDPKSAADIVHDLNIHPWPLPDECVLISVASHIVEHIPTVVFDNGVTRFPFMEFMDEVWRITKVDGELAIIVPHGSSQGYLQDPTHCHAMNEVQFAYFDPLEPNTGGMLWKIYRRKPWRIKTLNWDPAVNIEVVLVKRRWDRSYGDE